MPATPATLHFHEEDLLAKSQEEWYRLRAERLAREGKSVVWDHQDDALDVFQLPDLMYRPKPVWLIKDFVEHKGLLAFYGKPKTGKTAFLASLLWAWTAGKDWWFDERFQFSDPPRLADEATGDPGPERQPRTVLYIVLEGQDTFWARAKAWCDFYGVSMDALRHFYVADYGLALFNRNMVREDKRTWPLSLKMLYNRIMLLRPDILVIDTFSRATAGIDENSSQVAAVVGVLDDLRDEFGLTTILVHHSPKADATVLRGHSSLEGAASSLIYTRRHKEHANMNELVLNSFRNSGAGGTVIPFKLTPDEVLFHVEPLSEERRAFTVNPGSSWVGHTLEEIAEATNRSVASVRRNLYDKKRGGGDFKLQDGVVTLRGFEDPEVL